MEFCFDDWFWLKYVARVTIWHFCQMNMEESAWSIFKQYRYYIDFTNCEWYDAACLISWPVNTFYMCCHVSVSSQRKKWLHPLTLFIHFYLKRLETYTEWKRISKLNNKGKEEKVALLQLRLACRSSQIIAATPKRLTVCCFPFLQAPFTGSIKRTFTAAVSGVHS